MSEEQHFTLLVSKLELHAKVMKEIEANIKDLYQTNAMKEEEAELLTTLVKTMSTSIQIQGDRVIELRKTIHTLEEDINLLKEERERREVRLRPFQGAEFPRKRKLPFDTEVQEDEKYEKPFNLFSRQESKADARAFGTFGEPKER